MTGMPAKLVTLDPEQRAAVLAPRGPVCILAGAGTGKTRAITHRIAHLINSGAVDSPNQILAVTFTARAAGEMRSRLRDLGVSANVARTFHAAARKQLRYFWPKAIGGEAWDLLDGKLGLISRAASRSGMSLASENLRDLASEIEWAKASLITPDAYPMIVQRLQRDVPADASAIAKVYADYERAKAAAQLLDFDDLLLRIAEIIEQNPAQADEFRRQYRCFVVDEFQDVTPLQQRVLDAWLGDSDDVTVVGDVNQTIYSFAGATARPLLDFTRKFPHATVVRLERDYRSTPEVVTLANKVINMARNRPTGSRLILTGQRPTGPLPKFAEYANELDEAKAVAEQAKKLIAAGVAIEEIAILFRINSQSEAYEQALTAVGLPYLVRGGERFFARQEIREGIAALRKASSGPDLGSDLPTRVRAALAPIGLTEQSPTGGAAQERWAALLSLVELAEEFVIALPHATLAEFVVELRQRAEAQQPPKMAGVTLASLHAAKGLEWDAVFLVGLVDGTMPILYADNDQDAIEEERRLLYVGVTRAREHLSLSWGLARSDTGRSRRRSRFLYGLIPEHDPVNRTAGQKAPAQPKVKRCCRVCESTLVESAEIKLGRCETCPSDRNDVLWNELKAWRAGRAKQLKVPPYVVFTDATIQAIAEQEPTTDAALVAISGIGALKLDKFGADILELVLKYRSQ
jgi:DNA helicase-2/ATP-dependent DNA helicase PcrA